MLADHEMSFQREAEAASKQKPRSGNVHRWRHVPFCGVWLHLDTQTLVNFRSFFLLVMEKVFGFQIQLADRVSVPTEKKIYD